MFIGHFAVGFASKKAEPRPSLGTYFMAVSFLDLLWPIFLLLGIERVEIIPSAASPFGRLNFTYYPLSHSLFMTVAWATLFAVVYFVIRRDRKAAIWLWMCVASHWVLDWITHFRDLPIMPNDTQFVGLELWDSVEWTVIVEGAMFIAGIVLYLFSTKAKDKRGIYGFWILIALLVYVYIGNLFGPPPPDVHSLGLYGMFGGWLTVAWGYWINKNRVVKN